MSGRIKPLTLVVDAKIDAFKQGAAAFKATVDDMLENGGEFCASFDKQLDKMASASVLSIQNMAKGVNAEINRMVRDAEQASRQGVEFNPVAGFTAESQQLYADNTRRVVASLKQREAALREMAQSEGAAGTQAKAAINEYYAQAAVLTRLADAAELTADELQKVEVASGNVGSAARDSGHTVSMASGAMREGYRQVGFQVSDFAVQVGGGTSAIRAAAQQAPQLIQALALMGDGSDGSKSRFQAFTTFISGPWGAAITVGVSVLGALATSLLEAGDASDEAGKEVFDFSQHLNTLELDAKSAAAAMKQLADETRNVVRWQGNFDQQKKVTADQAVIDQQGRLDRLTGELATARENARATPTPFNIGEIIWWGQRATKLEEDIKATKEALDSARASSANLEIGLAQQRIAERTDPRLKIEGDFDREIGKLNQNRQRSKNLETSDDPLAVATDSGVYISAAEYEAEAGRLQKLKDKALSDLKEIEQAKARKTKARTPQQVFDDFKSELAQRGVQQAAGRTGYRSAKDQHEIFMAGESPLDGYKAKSRHQSWQAFDPTRASHDDSAARAAAEAAGLKGFQIVTESGGRKHYEWKGAGAAGSVDVAGAERAADAEQRAAERAAAEAKRKAEQDQRDREALEGALLASKEDQARLARAGVTDAAHLAALDKAAIDAGLSRKLAQNEKLTLDHSEVDALDRANAETEKRAVDEGLRRELATKAFEQEQARIDAAAELLQLEGQLATSTQARRDIALQLLDLWRKQAEAAAAQQLSEDGNIAGYAGSMLQISKIYGARKRGVEQDNQSQVDEYKRRLHGATDDMDEALDGVAARGLASLEDGLVGLVSGSESVAGAFKKMAASIIADLARIAVQQLILKSLSFIGFSTGTVPGKAIGNVPGFAGGIISGPGSGTSDSILAMHEGLGVIRVSNGESIITAAGTRKHRRLLKAINDGSLPAFASGTVPDVAYPAIPSAGALRARNDNPPAQYFDLRGAVVTEDLFRHMNQIGAAHAARALAAAPGVTREEMGEASMQRIPV